MVTEHQSELSTGSLGEHKFCVRTRRFDDVLAEMGEVAFPIIKVDIEEREDYFLRWTKTGSAGSVR
jgi:hypothetical protein